LLYKVMEKYHPKLLPYYKFLYLLLDIVFVALLAVLALNSRPEVIYSCSQNATFNYSFLENITVKAALP